MGADFDVVFVDLVGAGNGDEREYPPSRIEITVPFVSATIWHKVDVIQWKSLSERKW